MCFFGVCAVLRAGVLFVCVFCWLVGWLVGWLVHLVYSFGPSPLFWFYLLRCCFMGSHLAGAEG